MPSNITRRIERELGIAGLLDALSVKLSASDLQSLMIDVFRTRSERLTEAFLRVRSDRDALFTPSSVNARDFLAFDAAAFRAASEFEAVDLSPVGPFGSAFTLGGTSQNNVLTTIRSAEVLGDPTVALAFEAARRRRSCGTVRLCASQRVIRLQPFDVPGYSPHFRLFCLVSAGRDTGSSGFELTHLREHVRVYLRLFRALNEIGFALADPLVEFADMGLIESALAQAGVSRDDVRSSIRAHRLGGSERFLRDHAIDALADARLPQLESPVIQPLRDEFPDAEFRVNHQRLEGLGYYRSFVLRISPRAPDGNFYPVIDGGFTNWTARLLGNRKERLLISGIGSEFICKTYRRT